MEKGKKNYGKKEERRMDGWKKNRLDGMKIRVGNGGELEWKKELS